uniref:Uncharacterized protein n=1 Tax=Cucumis sativus TaxID=3659 RepID=A0A0A0KXC9_CUCSA
MKLILHEIDVSDVDMRMKDESEETEEGEEDEGMKKNGGGTCFERSPGDRRMNRISATTTGPQSAIDISSSSSC